MSAAAPQASAEDAPKDIDLDTLAWEPVGNGVTVKDTGNARGDDVLVAYAGYGVSLAAAQKWASALYVSTLRDRGFRQLYAVQGPADSGYGGKEIANTKIVASLPTKAKNILVIGHSSGSYVAHELLTQLASDASKTDTLARVVYFDLDGGTQGLAPSTVAKLRDAFFVGATDDNGTLSPNDAEMRVAGSWPNGTYVSHTAKSAGCDAGAQWCVHMTPITTRPHDKSGAKGDLDYSDFEGRAVSTAWLDANL